MNTLIEDNQLVFAEYNIGDKLRINYRDGTVIFGILDGFLYNSCGQMIINVKCITGSDNKYSEYRALSTRNATFDIVKI